MALQSVNHSTRCTRGRPSTSRTPAGSKVPSVQKPVEIMPATGSTKKTPRIASGTAATRSSRASLMFGLIAR